MRRGMRRIYIYGRLPKPPAPKGDIGGGIRRGPSGGVSGRGSPAGGCLAQVLGEGEKGERGERGEREERGERGERRERGERGEKGCRSARKPERGERGEGREREE